jgi:cation:H+ antiporter
LILLFSGSLILLGFLLLIKGADWMVNGASALAKKHHISDLAIGLTIVAFGTSAPELVVNTLASLDDQPDIVLGNVIGSNNFNLFIILGLVGLIFPISVQSTTVWREIPLSLVAALLLFLLVNSIGIQTSNTLSRIEGIFIFLLFLLFLYYVFHQMKRDPDPHDTIIESLSNTKIWVYILLGLACLILGGKLVVHHAVVIATDFGVSKKIIGLTILAAGTSLPELVTSVVAAIKKNSDIAIGNVIGSNIFNLLFILSISSIIRPIEYNTAFNTDLLILLGGTVFLFIAMFTGGKKKLDRWEAGMLLVSFLVYTIFLIINEL